MINFKETLPNGMVVTQDRFERNYITKVAQIVSVSTWLNRTDPITAGIRLVDPTFTSAKLFAKAVVNTNGSAEVNLSLFIRTRTVRKGVQRVSRRRVAALSDVPEALNKAAETVFSVGRSKRSQIVELLPMLTTILRDRAKDVTAELVNRLETA